MKGLILKGVGGLFEVRLPDGSSCTCRARGVFRHEKTTPLPGDTVQLEAETDERQNAWVIDKILQRRNALIRPALANVTHMFIVLPAARPEPDLLTMDKLISIAEYLSIQPVIVINKCDLNRERAEEVREIYARSGFPVFLTSAKQQEGIKEIHQYLDALDEERTEKICAFAGLSGVGKSTLVTELFPSLALETGDVSRKTEHGRHTTRKVELYPVKENLYVADTPGFSMLDFTRFNFFPSAALPSTFREFARVDKLCRYTKCTHTKEEGCAILEAVRDGRIPKSRHDSYCMMFEDFKAKPDWKRRQEGLV